MERFLSSLPALGLRSFGRWYIEVVVLVGEAAGTYFRRILTDDGTLVKKLVK
jgi:hypothetical protein